MSRGASDEWTAAAQVVMQTGRRDHGVEEIDKLFRERG